MPKKVQRRGRTQKGPEAEAPQQGETLVIPADVKRSDTTKENQAAQQKTQTTQEPSEKKELIKVLLEEENEDYNGRLRLSRVPTTRRSPCHARLLPTVSTTSERPPNELEDLVTSPTRPPFIPDHSRLF